MKILLTTIFLLFISISGFSQSRTYHTGPKGGCYYINGSGNKVYVDHSYCNKPTTTLKSTESGTPTKSKSSRSYTKGPKGGCYYFNSSGKKVYVDRSLCD